MLPIRAWRTRHEHGLSIRTLGELVAASCAVPRDTEQVQGLFEHLMRVLAQVARQSALVVVGLNAVPCEEQGGLKAFIKSIPVRSEGCEVLRHLAPYTLPVCPQPPLRSLAGSVKLVFTNSSW